MIRCPQIHHHILIITPVFGVGLTAHERLRDLVVHSTLLFIFLRLLENSWLSHLTTTCPTNPTLLMRSSREADNKCGTDNNDAYRTRPHPTYLHAKILT